MKNLNDLAADIRTGARRLEWITQLAEALDRIGSLEQAAAEAERRKTSIDNYIADLQVASEAAQSQLKNIRAQAQDANNAIEWAKHEADSVRANAIADADRIVEEARISAKALAESAEAAAVDAGAKARRDTDAMVARLSDMATENARLVSEIKERAAELVALDSRINAARQRAKDALAGI